MRPYWTIIKDSFAEALASRVLWIVFVVLTIILLAVAPLSITERRATNLHHFDIDLPRLIAELKEDSEAEDDSPAKRVWELADDTFKQRVDKFADEEKRDKFSFRDREGLLDALNDMLDRPDLYRESAWEQEELSPATQELLDQGVTTLSGDDVRVFNRLLVLDGFAAIRGTSNKEIYIYYLWWNASGPVPFGRTLLQPMVDQVLSVILRYLVGMVAVFISILVTAAMIPHAFEAGAIDLLLSKPVTRSLLFLVKFFGGCAFILLNSTYFIVGIWIIFGLRLGLWNHSILWCIPILLFQFIVYYAVSAWAAVQWKSPIVSVVVTFLFWMACFGVGTAKVAIEGSFIEPNRVVGLTPTEEAVTGVTSSQEWLAWRSGEWETMFPQTMQRRMRRSVMIGSTYDAETKQLMYMQRSAFGGRRFNPFQSASQFMMVQWQAGQWEQQEGATPPPGASWLFHHPRAGTIVVAEDGLRQFVGNSEGVNFAEMLGFSTPFVPAGPEETLDLSAGCAAAMDSTSADIALYTNKRLLLLKLDEKKQFYSVSSEKTLEDIEEPVMLTMSQDRVVLVESGGRTSIMQQPDFEILQQFTPVGKTDPYTVTAADGLYAVLGHNRKLAIFDGDGTIKRRMGNDVSAVAFHPQEARIYVADWGQRLTTLDAKNLQILERDEPSLNVLEGVYRYAILPVYTVFPKPGELGNLISYVMTDETSMPDGPPGALGETDLRATRDEIKLWGPIWSSLLFVVVVLGITCIHLRRADI